MTEAPAQDALELSLRQVLRDAFAQVEIQVHAQPASSVRVTSRSTDEPLHARCMCKGGKRKRGASQMHSQPHGASQRGGRKQRGGKKAGHGWKKKTLKLPQYQIRMYARGMYMYGIRERGQERRGMTMEARKRVAWNDKEEASEHRRRVTALLLLQLHRCPALILCSSSAMASRAEQWLAGRTTYPVSFHILVNGSVASTCPLRSVRLVIVYDDFCEATALMRMLHSLQSASPTVYHFTLSNNRCSNARVPFVSRLRAMGLIVPKVKRETLLNLAWTDHAAAKAMITASKHCFQRAPQAVRADRDLVLAAATAYGFNIFSASIELANDEQVVCTALYFKLAAGIFNQHIGREVRQRIMRGAELLRVQTGLSDHEAMQEYQYMTAQLPLRTIHLVPNSWQPMTLGCLNLAGEEIASVCLETSELETAEALRGRIASLLDEPKLSLRVFLPSGAQLPLVGPLRSVTFEQEAANVAIPANSSEE